MSLVASSILRLSFAAAFILALISAGYLWTWPDSRVVSLLLGMAAMIFVAAYVVLTWTRENQARRYHELIENDDAEIVQFQESVRLLAGVVEILRQDSEDLRQGHLVGEIRLDRRQARALSGPPPLKAVDDATAALLALPPPDAQDAAPPIK